MRKILYFLIFPLALQALSLRDEKGRLTEPAKRFLALFEVPSELEEGMILPYLQSHWLQYQKERWEMEGKFEDKKEEAFPILKELGCIDTIHAEGKEYDYALVLGAIGKTMEKRLEFLHQEWERGVRFKKVVLLTGQRDLDPERESFPKEITTEAALFIHLFQKNPLFGTVPHMVIDSPKEKLLDGSYRRPNTASTIRDWVATSPQPGKCLVISTQPFVGYQEAVVRFFLPPAFQVETVGPGTENVYAATGLDVPPSKIPYPMSIYLDNFAKWLLYTQTN